MNFFLISIAALLPAILPNAELWDGEEYHKHSQSQLTSAQCLIEKCSFKPGGAILDIGCGDGKITATLAEHVPLGRVVGIDISPSMIAYAQSHFPADNVQFELADAQNLTFNQEFDYVVSFTTLHWIKDKPAVIAGVKSALKPNGIFAFSIPIAPPSTMLEAAQQIAESSTWRCYFQGFKPRWEFPVPEKFIAHVKKADFTLLFSDIVEQVDHYSSKTQFTDYVLQWFPYLEPLPVENKRAFLDEVIDLFFVLESISPDHIEFAFNNLQVMAQKPY